jgi:hypothetical protein
MGIGKLFGSLKNKAKDATMDKVLERMRDLKLPVSQRKVNKMIASHVEVLDGVKSAKVDINRDGLYIKASFSDGRQTVKHRLKFVELIWSHHKRSFVFEPDEPFDCLKDHATYACTATTLAAVLKQMLGFTDKKLKDDSFKNDIGPVSGIMEKDGKIYYDIRRIPLLRQYTHYRVMGQAPMDHLNVVDCWFENGRIMVRIDNNKIVDQIKSMNLDQATLRKMMKGDMSDFTGDEE